MTKTNPTELHAADAGRSSGSRAARLFFGGARGSGPAVRPECTPVCDSGSVAGVAGALPN